MDTVHELGASVLYWRPVAKFRSELPKERGCLMSVAAAVQLMLMFGTFLVALLALVVELIKNQPKK